MSTSRSPGFTPVRRLGLSAAAILLLGTSVSAEPFPSVEAVGGPADTELQPPKIEILRSDPGTARGLVFVAPKRPSVGAGQQGPEIVDDQGRPIWFHPLSGGDQALDF